MKVLVTGVNGLLGQHLANLLLQNNFIVTGTGKGPHRLPLLADDRYQYHEADLTNEDSIKKIIMEVEPEIIVHAAAMTQVDECQLNQDACFAINVEATRQLALMAEQYSKLFIFLSTDFVFDGEKGSYQENDPVNPVSWYGFSKVEAERAVQQCRIPWAVVRTCLVYGNTFEGTRSNIITWVKTNLEAGREIRVVSDQVRTPTYVEDLALGILLIIQKRSTGIYHISGKDVLTPYEMALQTAAHFNLNAGLITKVDASVFTQPARRPPKTGFDISRARLELGFEPRSFEEGMRRMFEG